MKSKILKKSFYNRNTLIVAKELLGKFIVRKIGKKEFVGMIVEVEAYNGPKDKASHASRGMTARNAVMFGHPGTAYVYMIYGMYYCFNIVTEEKGCPAAVLVRAVEVVANKNVLLEFMGLPRRAAPRNDREASGPGKFCRVFKIDRKLNGVELTPSTPLLKGGLSAIWVEARPAFVPQATGLRRGKGKLQIVAAKRVGVDYAGEYKDKLWRFYIKGNESVSKL